MKFGRKLDLEKAYTSGFNIGEASGSKKSKTEIVKKMLKKGISIKDIIDITNLTKEEIEKTKLDYYM